MIHVAVLFSGNGGNALNLALAGRASNRFLVKRAVSSSPDSSGIQRLGALDIPTKVVSWGSGTDGAKESNEIFNFCEAEDIHLICLAGWLKKLVLPDLWSHRVLNIHPSLLPRYGGLGMYGARVHEKVVQDKNMHSGCTVHYVDNEYDHGPILLQSSIALTPNETALSLQQRVYQEEMILYPKAVLKWIELSGISTL